MSSNSPAFAQSNDVASDIAAPQQTAPAKWSRLPLTMRSPVWPGIVGTLIILAMLLAFHQVVLGAVQQGASRHQAFALHTKASWRCNTLPGQKAIELCLTQLNPLANSAPRSAGQTTLLARSD